MPALKNPRHEAFAQALARGESAAKAYIEAGYKANTGNASTLKSVESVSKADKGHRNADHKQKVNIVRQVARAAQVRGLIFAGITFG